MDTNGYKMDTESHIIFVCPDSQYDIHGLEEAVYQEFGIAITRKTQIDNAAEILNRKGLVITLLKTNDNIIEDLDILTKERNKHNGINSPIILMAEKPIILMAEKPIQKDLLIKCSSLSGVDFVHLSLDHTMDVPLVLNKIRIFLDIHTYYVKMQHECEQRAKTQEELKRMAMAAPNSITIHDFDGNFLYANIMTFKMHGYTRNEFMSMKLCDIDTIESAKLQQERIQKLREKGELSFEV
jgi:molybdenum cofactor biosynthesis enzyme